MHILSYSTIPFSFYSFFDDIYLLPPNSLFSRFFKNTVFFFFMLTKDLFLLSPIPTLYSHFSTPIIETER